MIQTKSFLKEIDFTKQELEELIDLSIKFKQLKKNRIPHKYLDSLNIALIFEKSKVCVCYICFYTLDFLCKTYKYHWNIGFLMTL